MSNWKNTLNHTNKKEKITDSLFGGGESGGGTAINPEVAAIAKKAQFKPFTITTSGGTAYGREGSFGAAASPQFQQLQAGALTGANQLLPDIVGALGREVTPFEFQTNADQLTQDYFAQQQALLQPAFEQQRQQLQNDLFGSGRMGLSLAGSSVGAGGGTMVNPDAFGLARAQSQTLGELAAQSRERALQDTAVRLGMESGIYDINQRAQQQRAQNLLAGTTGLYGIGSGVAEQELALLSGGLTGEQVRSGTYADAARAMAGGMYQEPSSGGKGLLGSIAGSALTAGVGGWAGSDAGSATISNWFK